MSETEDKKRRNWLATPLMVCLLFLIAAVAPENCSCPGDDDDAADDDTGDDDDDVTGDDDVVDDDTGDDDDDTIAPTPFSLAGAVYIIPVHYDLEEDGTWTRVEMEWSEIDPNGYQYGLIYVGIVQDFEDESTPMLHFVSEPVPADPKNDPTHYLFESGTWPLEEVAVMAIADTWYDAIISPWDSKAFHTDIIDTTGAPVEGADIFMDMEFVWNGHAWVPGHHWGGCCGGGGGGGGGGGDDDDDNGGGDDDDNGDDDDDDNGDDDDDDGGGGYPGDPNCPLAIGGDIYLHDSAHTSSTGNSLVAVYDETLQGPYWFVFPGILDGAAQDVDTPWNLDIYCSFEGNMRGAWDWNNNGLFEPGDDWGVTVNGLGEDNNPWDFLTVDIPDMEVQVPYDGTVIPMPAGYVKISGVVTTDGSFEFADLDPSNGLFVGANKSFNVPAIEPLDLLQQGYLWGFAQIPSVAGMGDAIPYSLWVPPYTTSFLKVGIFPTDLPNPTDYETIPVAVHVTTEDVVRNVEMSYQPSP